MASDGADSNLNPHVVLTQRIDTLEGSVHEVSQTLAELRREVAAMNVRQDGNPRRNQEAPRAYARGGLHYDEQPRRNQHRQPPVQHGPERDDSDMEREEERPLRQQRRDPGEYDYKQRAKDVTSFYGSMNVEDFLDWSTKLENFFKFHEIPMEKRVTLVVYKLKGGAQAWWKNLQINRERQGKLPIRDWNRMKQELRSRFMPPDHEQILFGLYQNCKQGFRSVEECTTEFHRLSLRNNLSETEPQQVMRGKVNLATREVEPGGMTEDEEGDEVCYAVGEIRVTERCRISFTIGKYKDEVLCDVVEMDACHLLLGRPWQFDMDAVHKGRENTYSFCKNGIRIVLAPLKPEEKSRSTPTRGNTLVVLEKREF
ncbi:hypothetical protein RJ639_044795 [Escallonia herrerae]|uniref:Retrotransposon gag domain-containing protein n=1 Tax=Escallonia herrerae TaxID=1293975 RepID=A0AA88WBC8_9ASTE|nr:hypothetical protein RJ639_044795 [Escallonia herrerae]